ncbi:prolyl oligopeptidase family serine peptidase [Neolewinella lacunae]|uniref:S9 family peptidase n=1 Tax=Neolewinella lacunae TaxID=1517758 RepID=A0A923PMM4_9BACT|nr:prolyl oligopeptidase family serine peptidase [Neolewinella lacunae]MBC6993993.1 S9 family peptidase [Neolewinella lacunae]MDN3634663.1 prolyl oligopeptidase family serine peptidase [Neolewinella lacunae]
MYYQTPSPAIADLVNLKPDPLMLFGPDRNLILMADRPSYPSIEELREPKLKLAGRLINPHTFMPHGNRGYRAPRLRNLATNEERPLLGLPAEGDYRYFNWSPSGQRFGFCRVLSTGLQVWIGELSTLQCRPIGAADLNNSLGGVPFDFVGDDQIIVRRRLLGVVRPPDDAPIIGPNVQDTSGQEGHNRTYTNLLETQHDVNLFRYYAEGQLYMVDLVSGEERPWGQPGIIAMLTASPNRAYFMISYVTEPFSFNVPYEKFGDRVEILDAEGHCLVVLAERPPQEDLPAAFGSVITGRRRFTWRSDHPAQIYWTEAQDGGDPRNEAEVRDQLFYLEPPFTGEPVPSIQLPLRFGALRWCRGDLALVMDWSWKDRRQVTRRWWPDAPERPAETWFDHNWEDNYQDPGHFVSVNLPSDHDVLLARDGGNTLVLVGEGHSPEGSRPFIDLFDVEHRTTRRVFTSAPPYYERPLFFLDEYPDWFLLAREQLTERPNFYLRNLVTDEEIELTNFPHPYPQLRDAQFEKVHYERSDGVKLFGDLHLPQGFRPGVDPPLPVLMWAYPQEFKDAEKAGQVTSSPYQFTRISPLAPLPFLASGYAVFDDFAMPIVGEGDVEPNETFIDQVQMNAEAAVRRLVDMGVADPARIYVGGHSYGAFMTAHLLAHTRLFAAGIARSGAYNRTLTPFGFQAEERNFWEVPDTYINLSPFVHANKINAPLLLIHGEEDTNSGTYPMQSKRMFAALNALGKTARLCLLPYEDHGYAAEESILHMLWEMETWMGKHSLGHSS